MSEPRFRAEIPGRSFAPAAPEPPPAALEPVPGTERRIDEKQALGIRVLCGQLGRECPEIAHLSWDQAGDLIVSLRAELNAATETRSPGCCRFCLADMAGSSLIEMGDGTAACADQAACWEREMKARGLR